MDDLEERLGRLSALTEPVRRALYRFVVSQREPVTRDQAAAGVDVARHVAKFNLDRLVDDGLLEADYRRPPGRGGPGAGRPAKVYRRADVEVEVSVPERHYDLAGRLLARAAVEADRTHAPVHTTLDRVATAAGREAGESAVGRQGRRRNPSRTLVEALTEHGYEPRSEDGGIVLDNCPFHSLACEETELVCGMNRSFLAGVIDGVAPGRFEAVLQPVEGRCCVRIDAPG
jgi:predicted ArsR family transcriptional regulator